MWRSRGVLTVMLTVLALVSGLVLLAVPGSTPAGSSSSGGGTTDAEDTTTTSTGPPATSSSTTSSTGPPATSSTTTSSTTTSTVATAPPPLPLTVSPSRILVGPGEVARITGACPVHAGRPLGPVVIWEIGASITAVPTGITADAWAVDWQAPAAADVSALQVWCGDPATWNGGYPAELQTDVVYVAQAGPVTGSVAGDSQVTGSPSTALPANVLPASR